MGVPLRENAEMQPKIQTVPLVDGKEVTLNLNPTPLSEENK